MLTKSHAQTRAFLDSHWCKVIYSLNDDTLKCSVTHNLHIWKWLPNNTPAYKRFYILRFLQLNASFEQGKHSNFCSKNFDSQSLHSRKMHRMQGRRDTFQYCRNINPYNRHWNTNPNNKLLCQQDVFLECSAYLLELNVPLLQMTRSIIFRTVAPLVKIKK